MKRSFAIVAALAALSAAPAFAGPAAPYVSLAVGGSNTDIDCTGTDSCSNNATAVKVIGGYDFGNQFAVEAMYVSLGEPKASVDGIDVGIESSYWGLGGAFRPAFNAQWSGIVRLGVAFTAAKAKAAAGGQSASHTYDSTNAYAGLGIAYAINKNVSFEADVDTTKISVGDGADKQDANVVDYTIGVTYKF